MKTDFDATAWQAFTADLAARHWERTPLAGSFFTSPPVTAEALFGAVVRACEDPSSAHHYVGGIEVIDERRKRDPASTPGVALQAQWRGISASLHGRWQDDPLRGRFSLRCAFDSP